MCSLHLNIDLRLTQFVSSENDQFILGNNWQKARLIGAASAGFRVGLGRPSEEACLGSRLFFLKRKDLPIPYDLVREQSYEHRKGVVMNGKKLGIITIGLISSLGASAFMSATMHHDLGAMGFQRSHWY